MIPTRCCIALRAIDRPTGVQVLKAGDAVVAAARRPEQSPGLMKLKQQHGDALQLVKLDVNDRASVTVCSRNKSPRIQLWQ